MSAEAILGPDEDLAPPPKKVSSSQALRALSRTPLDTNTVWTVVNASSPEPGSERNSPRVTLSPGSSKSSLAESPMTTSPATRRHKKFLKSPPPEPQESVEQQDDLGNDDDDDNSSSDDGFLAMAKPKSFANKRAILSPLSRSPPRSRSQEPQPTSPTPVSGSVPKPEDTTKTTSQVTVNLMEEDEEEEDGIFDFEGGPPSKARIPPEPIQEEPDEEEVHTPKEEQTPQLLSTSPAVDIPLPETPLPAHLMSASVGSFKGRSVTLPIVTNPEVYAQAASLGDISTFVGGLDGRTGTDEGDLASYRASVGQALFSGTPRSLTERMLMEDAQAQRRAAAAQKQS